MALLRTIGGGVPAAEALRLTLSISFEEFAASTAP